ncbi:hypothetical protein HDK93_003511 [Salmonella enterica subsp. enterica]|nr:hypothetical protein [Salmonella enterica subsp. enterica serovar Mississippi]EIB8815048.1 hypothetical protein [Salmonella enterica]
MKKTLIALAVAASAAVSGSAMAWTANGTGGSIELGGTLTPEKIASPWEAKVSAATGLDAALKDGQKEIKIKASSAIPLMGIRNVDSNGFIGGAEGVISTIDYGGVVDLKGFKNAVTTLTLDVKNASGEKIGTLSAPFFASAVLAYKGSSGQTRGRQMAAASSGDAFFGGVPLQGAATADSGKVAYSRISSVSSEYVATLPKIGAWDSVDPGEKYSDKKITYWGAYGSGIEKGSDITITLDKAVKSGDAPIAWKASFPVTITYS